MREKRVLRYYCDHCKKSGCGKYYIAKHEVGCTNNPQRKCGICPLIDNVQADSESLADAAAVSVKTLRDIAGNCPACMLAGVRALRKRVGPPVEVRDAQGRWAGTTDAIPEDVLAWDYKQESASMWKDIRSNDGTLLPKWDGSIITDAARAATTTEMR